ncbi:hypothetical protein [Nitrosomonas sp.]|uniref:hypothetical protein n=1 Tax=Nitrosomonas sp. TaxID=42353 RepID=UPI0025F1FB85|nr:hypothetical protein [Nitrosomonas sp.]
MSNFEDKTPATMELHTDKFVETKNFSYAMSAFCRARANGHPIPEVILEFIEKAFLEWGKYDGEKSLDEILGIKPGKGKKSVLSDEWTKQRNERLFLIMTTLIALEWSIKDAAEGACCWLQKQYEVNPIKHRHLKPSNAGRKNENILLDSKTLEGYWYDSKYRIQREEAALRAQTPLILMDDNEKADYQRRIRNLMGKI